MKLSLDMQEIDFSQMNKKLKHAFQEMLILIIQQVCQYYLK